MKRLRLIAPVVAIAVVAIAVLLISGARDRNVREYSLQVPDQEAVALLARSDRVCEGPVSSPRTFTRVSVWGAPTASSGEVQVTVSPPGSRRPLATGTIQATTGGEQHATLSRPVPAGTRVRICVTSRFNTFSLFGAPVTARDVAIAGHGHDLAFSLSLDDHRSLLGSLPTAFDRAALFKLSWLGNWSFWVLAIALLASFAVAVLAVASAAGEDADGDR